MLIVKAADQDVPVYFHRYVALNNELNLFDALSNSTNEFLQAMDHIPEEKSNYAYAENKWTIKELLIHVIDTERIFQYRVLRFLRGDATDLHSFDEDKYAPESNAANRKLSDIVEEFKTVRNSTEILFKTAKESNLDFLGSSNGNQVSPRGLGWMIAGHCRHHLVILKERYGV